MVGIRSYLISLSKYYVGVSACLSWFSNACVFVKRVASVAVLAVL